MRCNCLCFALALLFPAPDQFKPTAIIGLVVIIGGLVLYRWSSVAGAGPANPADEHEDKQQEQEQDALHAIIDPSQPASEVLTHKRLTHTSASELEI